MRLLTNVAEMRLGPIRRQLPGTRTTPSVGAITSWMKRPTCCISKPSRPKEGGKSKPSGRKTSTSP